MIRTYRLIYFHYNSSQLTIWGVSSFYSAIHCYLSNFYFNCYFNFQPCRCRFERFFVIVDSIEFKAILQLSTQTTTVINPLPPCLLVICREWILNLRTNPPYTVKKLLVFQLTFSGPLFLFSSCWGFSDSWYHAYLKRLKYIISICC